MSSIGTPPQIGDLYLEHKSWLHGWLRRRLSCHETVAELIQDTFVRILLVRDSGRELSMREPRAYLTTVAHNLLVNHYRRRELEQAYLEALALHPESEMPSPETLILVIETLTQIDDMLKGLGTKAREAFILSQIEGLNYAQIATRLGVTERTVKRYMAQAFEQCLLLME